MKGLIAKLKTRILIVLLIFILTACSPQHTIIQDEQDCNTTEFLRYAVMHKVNSLSFIYGDISIYLENIASGKMTIDEFDYYNRGVNRLLQDNNFRGAEAILFENKNDKVYQQLLQMNLPIIQAHYIAKNSPKEELSDVAEVYLQLSELSFGNNKEKSLSYCIGYKDINGKEINTVIDQIEPKVKYLMELISRYD